MLISEKIPLLRRNVSTNGMMVIPQAVARAYDISPGKEVVIALLEVLDHGEISRVNDIKVKVLTDTARAI
jgi:bifunctional DNA-binding transcriptional regulator/antitoxin component of YhaV-PrlF toxin-antitoxin module